MRALVTGAGGQLGRALIASTPSGWTCLPLIRAELDLKDAKAVRATVREHAPDVVFNAAAYTAVDRAESEEATAFAINVEAVRALADAATKCGAHLVHISSDFVFDGDKSIPYKPSDPTNPLSAYGRSKAAGELAAGLDATVVRTGWVYAAHGANFVLTMLQLLRSREEVRVVADQVGAPTWATDLADTLWGLGIRRQAGIWHHSDAGVASWYDFAVAIQEEAFAIGLLDRLVPVVPIATAEFPALARRPSFSLLDSSRTRQALGNAAIHWRANLRRMLAEAQRYTLTGH